MAVAGGVEGSVTAGTVVAVAVGTIGFGEASRVAVTLTDAAGVRAEQEERMRAATRLLPIRLKNLFFLLIFHLLF